MDSTVYFVKPGHTTQECTNPNAVVALNEGQSTTAAQVSAIFGQSEPSFSTLNPLTFVTCIGLPSRAEPTQLDEH